MKENILTIFLNERIYLDLKKILNEIPFRINERRKLKKYKERNERQLKQIKKENKTEEKKRYYFGKTRDGRGRGLN